MRKSILYSALVLLTILPAVMIPGRAEAQNETPRFYFCESYKDGREINVSNTFSTGYLTAILDIRHMETTIGVNTLALEITMIADDKGFYDVEQVLDLFTFAVDPNWDYIYFTEENRLKFEKPGIYRVMVLKEPNTQIAGGLLKITSKK